MNKGYILTLTLCILLSFTSLLSVKLLQIKSFEKIVESSSEIYDRLSAEKEVFDEIFFNLYLFDNDDFTLDSGEYTFEVTFEDEIDDNREINIVTNFNYSIFLKFNENCLCFIEILYL